MITITSPASSHPISAYAVQELVRLLTTLSDEPVSLVNDTITRVSIVLAIDAALGEQEIAIDSMPSQVLLSGGSPTALLHAVYTFAQHLGCVFDFSGEILPAKTPTLSFPTVRLRHTPSMPERGIRMHLNFVQDQSCFSEDEFAAFIDNMAKQRENYLIFHMYTPQQWFPFSYRGVKHLDLQLGNLNRCHLDDEMIGREKVLVKDHWFPREFEEITDPEELLQAVYGRYTRMMARAHARGIRNCVSFEPEALPPALVKMLPEWSGEVAQSLLADEDLSNDWQEGWSGTKLVEADIRHPLVIDISVERCLQCIDAFPDLDELQLLSREGTNWKPKGEQSFAEEITRLCNKFELSRDLFDDAALAQMAQPNEGPEMNPKAHPYWTVLPGQNYYATVIGSIRFVEHALAVLADKRVQAKLAERNVTPSIAVYSPNPETIRLMMPVVAAMIPAGMRFQCLADYGARDIAANLPAWQPLADAGQQIGVISWLEFDGSMMIAQGWNDSIAENVHKAVALGARTMSFNHWRVRSLEHNAAAAAAFCWDADQTTETFKEDYFGRLYGPQAVETAVQAYRLLEDATIYAKTNNYNIGFTNTWVFRNSTDVPGYYWRRLARSIANFQRAHDAFVALTEVSSESGKRQACYMADYTRMSVLHITAVSHLQNAKLPLIGYNAWPLGNSHAAWPPPEKLADLVHEAEQAAELEHEYMRTFAPWVTSCDEQGQIAMHHQGVIEPFTSFANALAEQLERERQPEEETCDCCGATC